MQLQVTGSIVLFKSEATVKQTITDFLRTKLFVKLFLVDNSPTDELKDLLAPFIQDPRVEYIFNNSNIGFGAAHNIAMRKALNMAPYHLVLNPDVTFEAGVLEQLYDYGELNKDAGLVSPRIIYPDGTLQHACKLLPSPIDMIFRRFLPASAIAKRMEQFEMKDSGYDKEMQVPYMSGCFMFLRTEALKEIGLFDERFFMYPEDIDLTRRMHRRYKTMFYPKVQITHVHAKESYKSLRLFWIHLVNMIKYFNKWGWLFDSERRGVNKKIAGQYNSR